MKRILFSLFALLLVVAAVGAALEGLNPVWWQNLKLRYYAPVGSLLNGEELERVGKETSREARVASDLLLSGGVARDGIPSIDSPRFKTAATTEFPSEALGLGLILQGVAKFYPYNILNWHEIVNDRLGGVPVTVTYCPLCETGIVFAREQTTYGVSGLLFESCLIMYARDDETYFAQPWGVAILGPKMNTALKRYPAIRTTLGAWQEAHPETLVLSKQTGYSRNYEQYPYGSYYTDRNIIFPVRGLDSLETHPKALFQYYWRADDQTPRNEFSGVVYKISFAEAREQKTVPFANGIRAVWDDQFDCVRFLDAQGRELPSSAAFAFVLTAMF